MDYESAFSTVDCVVGRRVQSAHANNSTLTLPLLLLLCAEAVHVSIHNGVSTHMQAFLRRGQEKKQPRKTGGFSVRFLWGNRKTDFMKSVFGCKKPKKKRPKKTTFGFRFTTLVVTTVTYKNQSRERIKVRKSNANVPDTRAQKKRHPRNKNHEKY